MLVETANQAMDCLCTVCDVYHPSSPLCIMMYSIRAIEENAAEALKSSGKFSGAFCGVKAISSTEWQAKVVVHSNIRIIFYASIALYTYISSYACSNQQLLLALTCTCLK